MDKNTLEELTDDSLAGKFESTNSEIKELNTDLKSMKEELFYRLDSMGKEVVGKPHLNILTDNYVITKEIRQTKTVCQETAVPALEKAGLDAFIHKIATIEVKEGVAVTSIPPDVLVTIKKYFNVNIIKSVDKKELGVFVDSGKVIDTGDLFDVKISAAVKVKKK